MDGADVRHLPEQAVDPVERVQPNGHQDAAGQLFTDIRKIFQVLLVVTCSQLNC